MAECSCGRTDGVLGYGGTASGIMFIGIAPGADEWRRTKRPLTGPSGQLLNAVLDAVGIERSETYCTNLICYWKDAPDKEDIQACAARLQQEIASVNPRVIVPLGKIAVEHLLGLPFGKARGALIQRDGRTWLPTYHPAACLHRAVTPQEKEAQIDAAYSLARDLSKLSQSQIDWPKPKYTVVYTVEEAQEVLDKMAEQLLPIALDIETNYDKDWEDAHPFDSDIVCIGVGNSPDVAFVLSLMPDQWGQLQWPTDCRYVYHNGAFDTQEIMRHTGVWLPIGDDTMLMSYSVDERNTRGLHKLKSLAREFCGADFYEEDDHKLVKPNPETDTETEIAEYSRRRAALYEYNAKDVVYTWRLHSYLKEWQAREGAEQLYEGLLLPGSHMLREAQYRGINADFPRMQQVSLQFYTEYAALQKKMNTWARDVLGDPAFNPRSPKQVKTLLELQGYPVPDTRKATLEQLVEDNPDIDFVPDLRRYRTLDKMCTNYLVDVSKQIKYDGRVHPHAFLIGTVNGRLTYTKPAMQTLPKPKTVRDLGVIRSIFTATTEDYVLLEADYAQIEGWVGAYLSEDEVLWEELSSGDWHTATTVNMFGKTQQDVSAWEWASLRDAGKHINYGIFFDESAQGLTRRPPIGIGQPLQVCQAYLTKWKQIHPKFMAYQAEQKRLAREQGFISTPFGRKRRFPFIVNDHQLRQAVNSKIQSTAGDYTLSSCIRAYKQLRDEMDTHLLFIEHDAGYWEVAKRFFREAVELIKFMMEAPPLLGLPSVKIEIDIGPNLAELEKLCPVCIHPDGRIPEETKKCRRCGQ